MVAMVLSRLSCEDQDKSNTDSLVTMSVAIAPCRRSVDDSVLNVGVMEVDDSVLNVGVTEVDDSVLKVGVIEAVVSFDVVSVDCVVVIISVEI